MRKKLFAVIMSAMMMITFMPTMAFAADVPVTVTKVTWDADYSTATVEGTTASGTFKEVAPAKLVFSSTDGKTTATLSKLVKGGNVYTFSGSDLEAKFYDFNGASIVFSDGTDEFNATIDADTFMELYDQTYTWKDPTLKAGKTVYDLFGGTTNCYVKLVDNHPAAGTTNPATKLLAGQTTFNTLVDFEVSLPKYEKYQASQNYDVAIKATTTATNDTAADTLDNFVINADKMVSAHKLYIDSSSFAEVGLKIDGVASTAVIPYTVGLKDKLADANTSLNKLGGTATAVLNTTYTGSAQNLEVVTKGLTVEYSVDNGKTWTATAPEIKDVTKTTSGTKFAVKVTNDKNVSKYGKVEVKINPAKGRLVYKKSIFNFAPKTEVKASDLVDFVAYEYDTTFAANTTPVKVAMNAEDTALAKTLIDKAVTIKNLDYDNANNTSVTVETNKVALKAAVNAEEAAYNFIKNFGESADMANPDVKVLENAISGITSVKVNFGMDYNDVTAVNKTVSYKAKKGKLAKTKTITLKATADFGTCTFTKMNTKGGSKIKVAKSGKVTIKKGLKKGTYKVKVKVKAPGTKANMYLTVKVK